MKLWNEENDMANIIKIAKKNLKKKKKHFT